MSLLTRIRVWLGRVASPAQPAPHPDCMSLRDWADLPQHHPRCG